MQVFRTPCLPAAVVLLAATLAGCGGSGGGSGSVGSTPGDVAAPAASILFPPASSRTDASTLTVTGTASDDGAITSVRVNGVDATTSDGFATWRASVPLEPGLNELVVETADDAVHSNFDTAAARATVVNEPQMVEPADLAVDAARDRILVVDGFTERVLAVDTDGRNRRVVSDDDDAVGVTASRLKRAALDPDGDRLILIEDGSAPSFLVAMDLDTGARTIVAMPSGGFGSGITAMAYDPTRGAGSERVLLVDRFAASIFAVDIATGTRTVLADASTGTGDPLIEPWGIAIDVDNGRALVTDLDASGTRHAAVVAIDLDTGDRTFVSPFAAPVQRLQGITLDAANDTAYAYSGASLYAIDTSSTASEGQRTLLADATTGTGETLQLPAAITFDASADRLLVSDAGLDAVVAVDPTTGDRTVIAGNDAGSGPRIRGSLEAVAFDERGEQAYVHSQIRDLWRIDLETGARTLFLDGDITFGGIRDIAIDHAGNRILGVAEVAFVSTTHFRAVGIDLDTAVVETVSGDGIGTGGDFGVSVQPPAIELDPDGERLLVARTLLLDDIMAVDLVTGDRALLSGPGSLGAPGTGTDFVDLTGLALDPANDRLLALGRGIGPPRLFGVDLDTGDRTVLSDHGSPGPDWNQTVGHIALDATRDRVLVVRDLNEVVDLPGIGAIDPVTGTRSTVSDGEHGNGTRFLSPASIAVDAARGTALVPDTGLGGLVIIELVSGDRVVVSR